MPGWVFPAVAVLGSAVAVAEYHLLDHRIAQFYVGSYLTASALMLWAIRTDDCVTRVGRGFVWLGFRLSMLVYLTHIGVGKVLDVVAGSCHWWGNRVYDITRWLIVMAASVVISFLIDWAIGLIKRKGIRLLR